MWPFMRGARNSRIKLMKFGLQMLIDEQQSLQCSAHVTIASCDDVFDSNFSPFGSHTNPLHNHPSDIVVRLGRNSGTGGVICWAERFFHSRLSTRSSPIFFITDTPWL